MKRTTIMSTMLLTIFSAATSYAACTAINSLPKTISSSGNYCLTGNMTTTTTGTAISINASNVVLDLADFEIRNTQTGSGAGIGYNGVNGQIRNIAIRNGRVIGFNNGVMFHRPGTGGENVASNVLIEGVTVVHNTGGAEPFDYPDQGIHIDSHSLIVRNCSVDSSSTGGASIAVIGNGVSVINNDVFNPGGDGITTSGGQGAGTPTQAYLIENNRVIAASAQGGAGISVPTENVIVKNNSIISMSTGVYFDGGLNKGLYRDNSTVNCAIPYDAPLAFDGGGNK